MVSCSTWIGCSRGPLWFVALCHPLSDRRDFRFFVCLVVVGDLAERLTEGSTHRAVWLSLVGGSMDVLTRFVDTG